MGRGTGRGRGDADRRAEEKRALRRALLVAPETGNLLGRHARRARGQPRRPRGSTN